MQFRADFKSRLANSQSVTDSLALAQEIVQLGGNEVADMAPGANIEFARECFLHAERHATQVDEYHAIARAAVTLTGDHAFATSLIEHALQIPMQSHPWRRAVQIGVELHIPAAALKQWIAKLIQAPKAAQTAPKASQSVSTSSPNQEQTGHKAGPAFKDIILAAQTLRDELAMADTARQLIAITGKRFESLQQACAVVEELGALEEAEWAQIALNKAGALCVSIPDLIHLARCTWSVFDDSKTALNLLGDAEADCQNTLEFLQLALAYKTLFEDYDRVDELMELATEYAIELEDKVHLAQGYWQLSSNVESASSAWRAVLDDLEDFDTLLDTGSVIAKQLGNKPLARQFLLKATQQAHTPEQWLPIIELVANTLADNTHAKELTLIAGDRCQGFEARYQIAASSHARNDLMLSENLLKFTAVSAESVEHYIRLAQLGHEILSGDTLVAEFLDQAQRRSQVCNDLLDTAAACENLLDDRHQLRRLLMAAQQRICSTEEAQQLHKTVIRLFPSETSWQQQIEIIKDRWRERQTSYSEYLKQFDNAQGVWQQIRIAQHLMADLQDKNITRKLLIKTEQALAQQTFTLDTSLLLAAAIDELLDEPDWVARLFEHAVIHCSSLVCLSEICQQTQQRIYPQNESRLLIRRFCLHYEQSLTNQSSAIEWLQLARLVYRHLQDIQWASQLALTSMKYEPDLHTLSYLFLLNDELGDGTITQQLIPQIQACCQSIREFLAFANHCKQLGLTASTLNSFYQLGEHWFSTPKDTLVWTEGIVDCLEDRDWANREYHTIARMFRPGAEQQHFQLSWHNRLSGRPDAPPAL